MNVRKQILVAALVTLGTPLVAAAATPDAWYAPLSAPAAAAKSETPNVSGDDSGAPTGYPLLSSHAASASRPAAQKSVDNDAGVPTSYALLSSQAASRG